MAKFYNPLVLFYSPFEIILFNSVLLLTPSSNPQPILTCHLLADSPYSGRILCQNKFLVTFSCYQLYLYHVSYTPWHIVGSHCALMKPHTLQWDLSHSAWSLGSTWWRWAASATQHYDSSGNVFPSWFFWGFGNSVYAELRFRDINRAQLGRILTAQYCFNIGLTLSKELDYLISRGHFQPNCSVTVLDISNSVTKRSLSVTARNS